MLEGIKMQIKYFIQVKGSADTGKTSTITRTFLKILELKQSKLEKIETLGLGDFVALISAENKILAFISCGDTENIIEKNYNKLLKLSKTDIDILILATRTKGNTINFWKAKLKENHKEGFDDILENKEWFSPEKKKEISPYIEMQSNKLLEKIEKILKGK